MDPATSDLTLADFDYALPPELIAQHPLAERSASRLLHVCRGGLEDLRFTDIERLLAPGSLLVVNDTRVLKARLHGHRASGGRVEALVERIGEPPQVAFALLRASHAPRAGEMLDFGDGVRARVRRREGDRFELDFGQPVPALLEQRGQLPLPPYIAHAPDAVDEARYQTVYASAPGAVAAPTAGLHFSAGLLQRLREHGVEPVAITLHVGAGTFQPVRAERIAEHRMHAERWHIGAAAAQRINAARGEGRPVWRWAPLRCAPWKPPPAAAACAPARARRGSSSRRATASRWSTGCSPTSTCPARRC